MDRCIHSMPHWQKNKCIYCWLWPVIVIQIMFSQARNCQKTHKPKIWTLETFSACKHCICFCFLLFSFVLKTWGLHSIAIALSFYLQIVLKKLSSIVFQQKAQVDLLHFLHLVSLCSCDYTSMDPAACYIPNVCKLVIQLSQDGCRWFYRVCIQ